MSHRCQQCGKSATLIWNLQTNRRLCAHCTEAAPKIEFVWRESTPDWSKLKEGIMCLRCVTKIEPTFEMLFVETESNAEALRLAAHHWPGVMWLWARPVGES